MSNMTGYMAPEEIAKNEAHNEKSAAARKALSKNSVAYVSTLDVSRHVETQSLEQKTALDNALVKIAKLHPVLAGLTFENKGFLTKDLDIDPKIANIVTSFMEQHGFKIEQLSDVARKSDLKNTMNQAAKEPGTARVDNYRATLDKILGNEAPDSESLLPVESGIAATSREDKSGQLAITFKANAELLAEIADADLTNDEMTWAINGSLKRAIRRTFIRASEIGAPTDSDKAKKYDSTDPVNLTITPGSGDVEVVVPLTGAVQWAFDNDVVKSKDITELQERLSLAVIRGIRLASALKQDAPALPTRG